MKLRDVIIQGKFCGLETVGECILNFELHTMQMLPYSSLESECKELVADIDAWENGRLKLDWEEINTQVAKDKREFEQWCASNVGNEDAVIDFQLGAIK